MKKFLFLLVILFAGINHAQKVQLTNFEEFLSALTKGEDVRAVIHYGKCKLIIDGEETDAPNAIGGMEIGSYEYFTKLLFGNPNAFISTSETVLIGHPRYGYVLNYAKIKVLDDCRVEIVARYLDPNSYEVKMDELFTTNINNGENEGAIYFYK